MSGTNLQIPPSSVPLGQSCIILDVRTDVEHREVALKQPHHHVPLDRLDPAVFMRENKIDAARPVYLLCRGGKRAAQAAQSFIAAGHDNVRVVEGGILACEAAGLPLRKGEVISLERQVRIAAGTVVLLGVLLGGFLSPWFYGLAGFAGAGLVFAGVTDTCAMGLLLAKAPWNKGVKQSCDAGGAGASCAAPAACPVKPAKEAQVKMPAGTAFYSPAGSAPASLSQPAAKTGNSVGGCS